MSWISCCSCASHCRASWITQVLHTCTTDHAVKGLLASEYVRPLNC